MLCKNLTIIHPPLLSVAVFRLHPRNHTVAALGIREYIFSMDAKIKNPLWKHIFRLSEAFLREFHIFAHPFCFCNCLCYSLVVIVLFEMLHCYEILSVQSNSILQQNACNRWGFSGRFNIFLGTSNFFRWIEFAQQRIRISNEKRKLWSIKMQFLSNLCSHSFLLLVEWMSIFSFIHSFLPLSLAVFFTRFAIFHSTSIWFIIYKEKLNFSFAQLSLCCGNIEMLYRKREYGTVSNRPHADDAAVLEQDCRDTCSYSENDVHKFPSFWLSLTPLVRGCSASSVDEWTPTQSHSKVQQKSQLEYLKSQFILRRCRRRRSALEHIFYSLAALTQNAIDFPSNIEFSLEASSAQDDGTDLHLFSVIFDVIKQKQEDNLLRVSGNPQTRSTLCAGLSVVSQ